MFVDDRAIEFSSKRSDNDILGDIFMENAATIGEMIKSARHLFVRRMRSVIVRIVIDLSFAKFLFSRVKCNLSIEYSLVASNSGNVLCA